MASPLADRIRPQSLEDCVGQHHLLSEGKILPRLMIGGSIPNMIFYGPSGTGKTTHMMHYKDLFGDSVTIINGDKPIIRLVDSELFVYGTPWCGKEGMNTNTKARLTDLCFINRSEENYTRPITKSEVASRIFSQIYLPKTKLAADNTLKMLDIILNSCNLWEINCTKEEKAAKVSYESIFKERI